MKRALDITFAVVGLIITSPLMVIFPLLIWRDGGGSAFYISERMKTPTQPFKLIKFRTMTEVAHEQNAGVTGGDKSARITPIGRILRRYRIDELPQLINVVRGDMSLVGPRPPLRQYTDAFPELYARVLQSRPGITGLATLHFHRHEEWLISGARTPEDTERIYATRCVPRKAKLDLIYQRHASVCFDAVIMLRTLRKILRR